MKWKNEKNMQQISFVRLPFEPVMLCLHFTIAILSLAEIECNYHENALIARDADSINYYNNN